MTAVSLFGVDLDAGVGAAADAALLERDAALASSAAALKTKHEEHEAERAEKAGLAKQLRELTATLGARTAASEAAALEASAAHAAALASADEKHRAALQKALEERATMERNRAPPQPALTEAEDLEHFLREGRRKQAEKYLDTQLVAFRFEGELDPDPRQAPLVSFHPMREVVHALEEETYAFRPDAVFGFLREALVQ